MSTNDKIETLRERMHKLIAENAPYEKILKASQELDVAIVEHMKGGLNNG